MDVIIKLTQAEAEGWCAEKLREQLGLGDESKLHVEILQETKMNYNINQNIEVASANKIALVGLIRQAQQDFCKMKDSGALDDYEKVVPGCFGLYRAKQWIEQKFNI